MTVDKELKGLSGYGKRLLSGKRILKNNKPCEHIYERVGGARNAGKGVFIRTYRCKKCSDMKEVRV
jgi:hypothetical protein